MKNNETARSGVRLQRGLTWIASPENRYIMGAFLIDSWEDSVTILSSISVAHTQGLTKSLVIRP